MKITKELNIEETKWRIIPEGDIDIHTSDQFKEEVLELFNEKNLDLVIDGKKLDYIDSMGLGALIHILKELKNTEYQIYLENIKPNIKKLLEITELDKMFKIRGENIE